MCDNHQGSGQNFKNKSTGGAHNDNRAPRPEDVPKPCCGAVGGRNLIVCIDGTANQFGQKNTNVIELYNLILKEDDDKQLTWYNSGIGTYARPSWKSFKYYRKVVYHAIDLAIAWDFERTVLAAYRWLSDNYQTGDCIFLFGFSRGAFQVRALSAMIDKVGLIRKGNEEQIPFAYELYADPKAGEPNVVAEVGSPETRQKLSWLKRVVKFLPCKAKETGETKGDLSMAERFKKAFSRKNVRVHFVGVWDTVSSIGIARGTRMLPQTIEGMKHVCYFRQALALDERRVKFCPEYAYGGSASSPTEHDTKYSEKIDKNLPDKDRKDQRPPITTTDTASTLAVDPESEDLLSPIQDKNGPSKAADASTEAPPHTLEVWFAGTHSDIGGGNALNPAMDRSRPPLRWMVFEAGAAGLRTERFDRVLDSSEQIEIKESLTWHWWILEMLPLKRLTYTRNPEANGKETTHKPHLRSSRKIHVGQKIHGSLTLTDKDGNVYTPRARPANDEPNFWKNVRSNGLGNWKAVDLYEGTRDLVEIFVDRQDLNVWKLLRQTASSADGRQAVYEGVIEALTGTKSKRPMDMTVEVKHQLINKTFEILKDTERKDTSLKLFHSKDVRSSLADLRESGKEDHRQKALRFMEQFLDCGPLYEMMGHTGRVLSVAFSPDSKQIVSGSGDKTVRIWNTETGELLGEPMRGHTDWVRSVAISPDGNLIASGSLDKTVRIWDTKTGKLVGKPLERHQDFVFSVAFSPENKRVASGSEDNTVQIWDVEGGRSVGEPLRGHTGDVNGVAFSPDGKYISSGSDDGTVRIWDAETGQPVGKPLQGHSNPVLSMVFSPDGRRIVSGSSDSTVRIWDVETLEQVGKPFQGHSNWVRSVAFSPDGRRVVSGSEDATVHIWDADTGEIENTFRHQDWVRSVAFSSDGKLVASGCNDGVVRIWDAQSW